MDMEVKENKLTAKNLENFLTEDQLNALIKKLGGLDNIRGILEGEITVMLRYSPKKIFDKSNQGEILSVISDGKSGEQWIDYFEGKRIVLSRWFKQALRSLKFSPTLNQEYQLFVLKGDQFIDNQRYIEYINQFALKNRLSIPPLEVICLLANKIPEYFEKFNLISLVITTPIEVDDGYEKIDILLRVGYLPSQKRIFLAELREDDWYFLPKDMGFVYLVSNE